MRVAFLGIRSSSPLRFLLVIGCNSEEQPGQPSSQSHMTTTTRAANSRACCSPCNFLLLAACSELPEFFSGKDSRVKFQGLRCNKSSVCSTAQTCIARSKELLGAE